MISGTKTYDALFTWEAPYGENVFLHNDGACSVATQYGGIDADLLTAAERVHAWTPFETALRTIPAGYCTEWHCFRERDDSPARRYLALNDSLPRGAVFSRRVREEMAAHLGPKGFSNRVYLITTKLAEPRFFLTAKKRLLDEAKKADQCLAVADDLAKNLRDPALLSCAEYGQLILQAANRRRFLDGERFRPCDGATLAESLITKRPSLVPGCTDAVMELDGVFYRTLFLYLLPDADPGWILQHLAYPITMHVSHTVYPIATKKAVAASENAKRHTEGLIDDRASQYQRNKAAQLGAFGEYVVEQKREILRHQFIFQLYGTLEDVTTYGNIIRKSIGITHGQVRDADYIQSQYYQVALPGQGYRGRFRPDEHGQIANMLPVQVWSDGDPGQPEILRLGASGQLVTLNVSQHAVAHTFVGGMTRSGKDSDFVTEVAETFPWCSYLVAEIDPSYQYVVEAYGGNYLRPDPESVINPLPLFAAANHAADKPLDVDVVSTTVQSLAFLLNDGKVTLNDHQTVGAQWALQYLYAVPDDHRLAPTLADYLVELERLDPEYFTSEQMEAAKTMAANLHSFLDTAQGMIFTKQENLTFSPDITGVDLRFIRNISDQLALFYLVFIAMRYNQLAFMSGKLTRIVLNELHELVRLAPDVIGALASSITRMGAKQRSYLTILSQSTDETEKLDSGILEQMPIRHLLFRRDNWEHIGERLKINTGPLERWKSFPYPIGRPYRESIRAYGDNYYHLHNFLPPFCLNLADSSPEALIHKRTIRLETRDPFERLRLLGQQIGRPI